MSDKRRKNLALNKKLEPVYILNPQANSILPSMLECQAHLPNYLKYTPQELKQFKQDQAKEEQDFAYNAGNFNTHYTQESLSHNNTPHVVVGVSGGVDSSLSLALLKEANFKVTALFMKNWEEDDTNDYCSAAQDKKDAQDVCDKLGVELKTINFAYEYWDRVFENFLSEYKSGRTPNPDILCNKEIKFKAFLDYALADLNADYIATGHYCLRNFVSDNSPISLLRGLDPNKDQSYFLHAIGPNKLNKVLFPVGHLPKTQVRQMAQERGLITASKKDSTGICFIGEKRFNTFLKQYLPDASTSGPIVNLDNGKVVGEHMGLMYCTIGQRKGLNIGGSKDGTGEAWYVVDKDLKNNALIVVQGHKHPAIYAGGLIASQDTWIKNKAQGIFRCTCKVRYRQPDVKCTVIMSPQDKIEGPSLAVYFDEPVASVAKGQSVVFYHGLECLGGAIIEDALPPIFNS